MKKLVIFSLVISSLFSVFSIEVDAYRRQSSSYRNKRSSYRNNEDKITIKKDILNINTIRARGYEGFGFLEYSGVNKKAFDLVKSYLKKHEKIEGTALSRNYNYSNGDYLGKGFTEAYKIDESGYDRDDLKNGDKIRCYIRSQSRDLPFGGRASIEIKNLKKIPKQIDFKKCDKEVGKAFNQMLYGIDGAGYFEDDFDTRRMESIRPYTSDINFSNLDIIKVNGQNYISSRDNNKFKNGDIVTIKINDRIKKSLEDSKGVKFISDTVNVKINSLLNPLKICYADSKKKEAPISDFGKDISLELDKKSRKYVFSRRNPEGFEKSPFGTDEENGYVVDTYGVYISNKKATVYDGYSINYPVYALLERKGKDNKVDYKVVNTLNLCITTEGKKIYWGEGINDFEKSPYSDVDRNWNTPTTAVVNVSKFDDPYFKEFDLVCLWNKNNNFETLKINTK